MASSIEERVVRMEFDNASFERKMSSTIQSLEKLNTTLANTGSKNGLEELSRSANRFSMEGMGRAIDGISSKFLALATVGITALANITNKAVDAGLRIAKSLTLDQVISGYKEYELQIGSIQTILANTSAQGTNLEQVNAALDELNAYSDKTIYNFAEMTRNIGTFTAAGVDLDTSVQSIKGIANVAAISGSNSQQASTAMYQLSQAIATGSVKLMDWNSVVNAGMGGKVFQKALWDTGMAMGTITDVPMGQTFEEWTDAGNSFRSSLQDGWLTADVLTNTLSAFTGEMTEAQLMAIGYTKEQAAEMMRLGELGVDAATKVRTFTQMLSTAKEAISSGWAQSFRTIFGDFEEATELWTGVSEAIGGMISKSADARNAMLKDWADLGGRTLLINALREAFKHLGEIFKPIKEAFREIFPATTGQDLFNLTVQFMRFAEALKPSEQTIENVKRIFKGFFSVLSIGWTVIKEGVGFIASLLKSVSGAGSGGFLKFAASIADFFTKLQEGLVKGEGIKKFFDGLAKALEKPLKFVHDLVGAFLEFFSTIGGGAMDAAGEGAQRLGDRFANLKNLMGNLGDIWHNFAESMGGVTKVLDSVWQYIRDWFSDLGMKLADEMQPGDFNNVLDSLNVGLLGGIVLLLKKFLDNGLSLDFGGGLFGSIKNSFEELTGVLNAMQTNLKAEALLKIAGAIGIMALSLLVLSTIDSGKLTAALTAMAVGFGQLVGVMALLDKAVSGPVGAAKLGILAAGLILLSTAILILSAAVKVMSSMSWGELLRGLVGVAAVMGILVLACIGLNAASGGMVRAGAGMILMAVALRIMASAVEAFSRMDWKELGKGLAGVAGGLALITLAMNLMPKGAVLKGAGLLLTAAALRILASAVKEFAGMSWTEMGKGLAGVAGGLLLIAGAMQLMPLTMPITAVGLILVGAALLIIAKALQSFGGMSWDEIGHGLAAMAGSLIILAAATYAMSGAIPGAIAIGIVSASLLLLLGVIKGFASMNIGDLIQGLVGLAATLAVLGLAAYLIQPLIPALMGLGVALILVGGGFALFGLGAMGVAKALQILAQTGGEAIDILIGLVDALIERIPALLESVAVGLIGMATTFIENLPALLGVLKVLISKLLETLTELIPQAVTLIVTLIESLLAALVTLYPQVIDAGIALLTALLTGIRDNIDDIVILVGEIIVAFLEAMTTEIPRIVDALVTLYVTVLTTTAERLGEAAPQLLIGVGRAFLQGLWTGIKEEGAKLWETIKKIIDDCVRWLKDLLGIHSPSTVMIQIGKDIIQGLLNGVTTAAVAVTRWFRELPGKILGWIGTVTSTLLQKGRDLISGFYRAASEFLTGTVMPWVRSIPGKVLGWIGSVFTTLGGKGHDLLAGLYNGAIKLVNSTIIPWFTGLGSKIVGWIGNLGSLLLGIGKSVIQGLWDGMQSIWDSTAGWLGGLGSKIMSLKGPPEKDAILLEENGRLIFEGLHRGMEDEWDNVAKWLSELNPTDAMGDAFTQGMNKVVGDLADQLERMDELNPVVTPVLDLTTLRNQAGALSGLLGTGSYSTAQTIASSTRPAEEAPTDQKATPTGDITFEQNIYAPKQLSTADIYKQTRNQIMMAKEELSIP
jgi:tape measure domain-containing protein